MTISNVYLKRDEALKFVKKSYVKGVSHFVRGGAFLYTEIGEEARGYEMSNLIAVSQKVALKYISDMISDKFDEKGVKIKIGITVENGEFDGSCIFIG